MPRPHPLLEKQPVQTQRNGDANPNAHPEFHDCGGGGQPIARGLKVAVTGEAVMLHEYD
jgi:hypothetical protein